MIQGWVAVQKAVRLKFQLVESWGSRHQSVEFEDPSGSAVSLTPANLAEDMPPNEALLTLPGGLNLRVKSEGGDMRAEDTTLHPKFGISIPNRCPIVPLVAGRANLDVEGN